MLSGCISGASFRPSAVTVETFSCSWRSEVQLVLFQFLVPKWLCTIVMNYKIRWFNMFKSVCYTCVCMNIYIYVLHGWDTYKTILLEVISQLMVVHPNCTLSRLWCRVGGGSPTNTGFRSKTGYIYIYIYIIRVLKIIKMDIFMTIYWNILPVYWDTMEHSMG